MVYYLQKYGITSLVPLKKINLILIISFESFTLIWFSVF
jgi:hypothetical protein